MQPTADCLRGYSAVETNQGELDYVAQDAGAGALKAEFDGNGVTISFERSESDAKRTQRAYEAFAGAFDTSTEDVLERRANAVLAWDKSPTDDEKTRVIECLREEE